MPEPETVLSEDEVSRSTNRSYESGSSTGTNNLDVGIVVPLAAEMCGHIFTNSKFGAKEFVCLTESGCSRPHHRHSKSRAPVGFYYATFQTGKKTIDGVYSTGISPKAYEAKLRQEEKDRKAAMAALGAAKSPRTPWQKTLYQEPLPGPQGDTQVLHVQTSFNDPYTPSGGTRASTTRTSPSTDASNGSPEATTSSPESKAPSTKTTKQPKKTTEDGVSAQEFREFAQGITKWIAQVESLKAQEAQKARDNSDSDSNSSASRRRRRRKKKEKKKSKHGKKGSCKSKGRRRRSPSPSSDSSKASDPRSDSNSDEDSADSRSSAESLPKSTDRHSSKIGKFYAVVQGKGGCCGIYRRKKEVDALRTSGTQIKAFNSEAKAWKWFDATNLQRKVQEKVQNETVDGPAAPPIELAGKDPSTGEEEELFDIKTDVSTNELLSKLSPPGVDKATMGQLGEAMLDATAIPGKAFGISESEEVNDGIGQSLAALVGIRQTDDGGDVCLDLRWRSPTRISI